MALAYSYIRFSRPEQMRGDSLRRQLEKARSWAAERGLVLDDSLRDLGVSAFRGKQRFEGALARFLELVNGGKVPRGSYLIVESLDRVSREKVREIQPFFLHLINAGITIVTLADGQEYSAERIDKDPSSLFMSLIVMTRAHEESRIKSQRLSDVWSNKRANAAEKVITGRVPAWLKVEQDGSGKRIVEIPERVAIIKRIFARSILGHGRYAICRDLNRDGIPAFQARAWQPSYITKVLSNRATVGELQNYAFGDDGKRKPVGEPIAGYYPVVVDELTFQRANAARERRNLSGGRHGSTQVPLLRGLVRCAACGGRMLQVNKGPGSRGGRYFACADLRRGLACTNDRVWSLPQVEDIVVARLAAGELAAVMADHVAPTDELVQGLEEAIQNEERARKALLVLVEEGDEEAIVRYRERGARLKALKAQFAAVDRETRRDASEPNWQERREAIADLMNALAAGNSEVRLRLAQEIRGILAVVQLGKHSISVRRRAPVVLAGQRSPVQLVQIYNDHPDHIAMIVREAAYQEAEASGTPGAIERMLRKYAPRG